MLVLQYPAIRIKHFCRSGFTAYIVSGNAAIPACAAIHCIQQDIPDGGGSFLLSRIVGAKRFNEMYLFSRNITMAEAKDLGLINFVWEEGEIDDKLEKMIRDLKALPIETIAPFKDLVNRSLFTGLEAHLDKERFYVTELGGKPQFKERLDEFFKKR